MEIYTLGDVEVCRQRDLETRRLKRLPGDMVIGNAASEHLRGVQL